MLTALTATRKDLGTRTDKATATLKSLRANRRAKDTERRSVEKHIDDAKKIESTLEKKEVERLAALDKKDADEAQAKWVRTGVLDKVGTDATPMRPEGHRVRHPPARQALRVGCRGPRLLRLLRPHLAGLARGFYHVIPRTSEEQWRRLKHVPVEDMRPGDLIIYFADASHVALYIGDGKIIQAPRPGRWVYVSPAASMEILGVVRPDA